MALFFIALKLVLLTRVSKVMNGKKVHLPPRLQPRSQVLSLSLSPSLPLSPSLSLPRSVKRVGENPGNEVAVASSIISGVGDGEGNRSLFSFFFKFVAAKYVLNCSFFFSSLQLPNTSSIGGAFPQKLGVYLFSDKVFVSLGHNLSPRDVNDKVAIITILIIKK